MIEPTFPQEAERVYTRVVWIVGAGVVALTLALVGVAWLLVVPPPPAEHAVAAPSVLERSIFDRASTGADVREAGEQRLERTEWVDRRARRVRIPIDRAIDAVVANPELIDSPAPGLAGEVGQ
jgi:hypothetical protein